MSKTYTGYMLIMKRCVSGRSTSVVLSSAGVEDNGGVVKATWTDAVLSEFTRYTRCDILSLSAINIEQAFSKPEKYIILYTKYLNLERHNSRNIYSVVKVLLF